MGTERPRYTVSVDQDLFDQIEEYRFKHRYKTRSDATVDLISRGLLTLEQNKKNPPVLEKPETGEEKATKEEVLFYHKLINVGLLREGQDLTDTQVAVLQGIHFILQANFADAPMFSLTEERERDVG